MTALTTGSGSNKTTYSYDSLGRVTKITAPMGYSESYTYDLNNNVLTKTDKNGSKLTYTYDAMNRITKEACGSEVKGEYTYNAYNYLATAKSGTVSSSYGYTVDGKVLYCYQNIGSESYNVVYLYDDSGNLTYRSLSRDISTTQTEEIQQLRYTYDTENRLTKVTESLSGEAHSEVASYGYDGNGCLTSAAYANGTSTAYTYDAGNRLTKLENKSGSSVISSYAYTYFNDGNVSKKTENTGKVTSYTYDNLNRLKTETVSGTANLSYTYAYDLSSNRSSLTVAGDEAYTTSYTYDANNRLKEDRTYTSATGTTDIHTYAYDKNGNQTRKYTSQAKDTNTGTTAIALQTFDTTDFEVEIRDYDSFNRMTSFKSTNGTTASYTYLPNGLRNSKTVNGTTTYFLWDKDSNILADLSSSATISNVYTRGTSLIKNSSGTYYSYNGHGDVTALTNSSGTVTKSYAYDAFGNEVNKNDSDTNPFRYCGEYYDSETNDIYLRARYYSPLIGRFTSMDSHWNTGNMIYGDKNNSSVMFCEINFSDNYSIIDKISENKAKNCKAPDILAIRQSDNLYAYCTGNPNAFQDDTGEIIVVIAGITLSASEIAIIGSTIAVIMYLGNEDFRNSFNEGITELGKSVSDAVIFAKGKTKKPKIPSKLLDKESDSDETKVKTPDTHPDEFEKKRGSSSYTHKKTGWTFRPANDHGGDHWDASPDGKNGNYVNVSKDGRIL